MLDLNKKFDESVIVPDIIQLLPKVLLNKIQRLRLIVPLNILKAFCF